MKEHIGKKVRLKRLLTDEDYTTKVPKAEHVCGDLDEEHRPKLGKEYTVTTFNENCKGYGLDKDGWCHPSHLFDLVEATTELTSLPEKWFIKPNKEVLNWFSKNKTDGISDYAIHASYLSYEIMCYPAAHGLHTWPQHAHQYREASKKLIEEDYVEITFEQFKRWVLKEETLKPHAFTPKAGDQVKYTGGSLNKPVTGTTYTVERINGPEVHLRSYEAGWVSINWFNGSQTPQFTLIKATEPTKTEEFKVGDWAVCIDSSSSIGRGLGWELGLVFKSTPSTSSAMVWGGKGGNGVYIEHLRKALPHEIPTSKPAVSTSSLTVTNQRLLEQAIATYPVGTKIQSLYESSADFTAEGIPYWYDAPNYRIIAVRSTHSVDRTIYDKGKWAKILDKSPEPTKEELLAEAKRRYPIGTKVKEPFNLSAMHAPPLYSTVDKDDHRVGTYEGTAIWVGANNDKHNIVVYSGGKWAEIVKKAEQTHPEYVECITKGTGAIWVVGQVYKTDEKQSDYPNRLAIIGANDHLYNVYKWDISPENRFKPSTKEAYDRQKTPKSYYDDAIISAWSDDVQAKLEIQYDLVSVVERQRSPILKEDRPLLINQEKEQEPKILLLN